MLKILIIRTTALGDIVHTFPALMALRAAFPTAHIGWVVEKRFASILKNIAEIDTIHSVELKKGLSKISAARRELKSANYDITIDFQGLLKSALIGAVTGAAKRFGFSARSSREGAHLFYTYRVDSFSHNDNITRLNLALVHAVAGLATPKDSTISFPCFTSQEDVLTVKKIVDTSELGSTFALINPGGAWHSKLWGTQNYATLIELLRGKFNLSVILTCFGAEKKLGDDINVHLSRPAPICDTLSYTQQAELSKHAVVAIGPDTGPLHIAHAVNCPTIFLFGASDSWRNTPSGNYAFPIQAPFDCAPCWKKKCPRFEATRCMQSITPAMVCAKFTEILSLNINRYAMV